MNISLAVIVNFKNIQTYSILLNANKVGKQELDIA